MIAFLTSNLSGYLLGFGAIVIAFIATYMKGRLSGAKRERDAQVAAEAKARSIGQQIDDAVAGRSPDENRKELGEWSAR